MITINDIKEGERFKCGKIVWVIDRIDNDSVYTSMEGGKKSNYRDDINEVVAFLNEENAIFLGLLGRRFVRKTTQKRKDNSEFTFIQEIEVINENDFTADYDCISCNTDPITGTKLLGGSLNIKHIDEMIATGRLTPIF